MRTFVLVVALAGLLLTVQAAGRPAGTGIPRTAIFYYPWFGTPAQDGAYQHWAQNHHFPPADIASAFYPVRGVYSSSSSPCSTSPSFVSLRRSTARLAEATRRLGIELRVVGATGWATCASAAAAFAGSAR